MKKYMAIRGEYIDDVAEEAIELAKKSDQSIAVECEGYGVFTAEPTSSVRSLVRHYQKEVVIPDNRVADRRQSVTRWHPKLLFVQFTLTPERRSGRDRRKSLRTCAA